MVRVQELTVGQVYRNRMGGTTCAWRTRGQGWRCWSGRATVGRCWHTASACTRTGASSGTGPLGDTGPMAGREGNESEVAMYKQTVKIPSKTVNTQHFIWESRDGGYPDEIIVEDEDGKRIRYIRSRPGSLRDWAQSCTTKGFFLLWIASFWVGVVVQVFTSLIRAGAVG